MGGYSKSSQFSNLSPFLHVVTARDVSAGR